MSIVRESLKDPTIASNLSKELGGLARYEYPQGIGVTQGLQHFMLITERVWVEEQKSKDGFNGQHQFQKLIEDDNQSNFYTNGRAFLLHLPTGSLKTQYSSDYNEVNMGVFGEMLSQNVNKITDTIQENFGKFQAGTDSGFLENTMNFYKNVGKDVKQMAMPYVDSEGLRDDFANRIKFNVSSAFGNLAKLGGSNAKGEQMAAMSMRAQRNPYTSLIFAGVKKLRTHNFAFEFNPKDSDESKRVMSIIVNLKDGSLPSLPKVELGPIVAEQYDVSEEEAMQMSGPELDPSLTVGPKKQIKLVSNHGMNSAFFKFPNTYKIRFYSKGKQNKKIHQIGSSFLTSIKVKYAPTFFDDTGLPTQIQMQLSFKENFGLDRSHAERNF